MLSVGFSKELWKSIRGVGVQALYCNMSTYLFVKYMKQGTFPSLGGEVLIRGRRGILYNVYYISYIYEYNMSALRSGVS